MLHDALASIEIENVYVMLHNNTLASIEIENVYVNVT
jgi:hypothetical protein